MRNIILYEQWKELYTNYLVMKSGQRQRDYTYRGGGINVTITANQRNYRQITTGD